MDLPHNQIHIISFSANECSEQLWGGGFNESSDKHIEYACIVFYSISLNSDPMIVLLWNCRGSTNQEFRAALRDLITA